MTPCRPPATLVTRGHRPCVGRAYMLIEMLVVIILLGVFALIAGQVFVTYFQVERQTRRQIVDTTRLDNALLTLRRDVWNAQALHVATDGTLVVQTGTGPMYRWHWDAKKRTLRRLAAPHAPDAVRQWGPLPWNVRWTVHGAVVDLALQVPGWSQIDRMTVVSPLLLVAKEPS